MEGKQSSLKRRETLQFQKCEDCLFQFGYFRAGVVDMANHEVQMRFVSET